MVDAPADAPIEKGEPYVDGNGSLPASLLDQGTDLDQQLAGSLTLQIQISLRHPYPFTMFTRSRLPMNLGSMLPMRFSKEKVDRFSGDKLRPTVQRRGRDSSSRRKMEPMAYSKLLTQDFLRLRCSYEWRGPREQYGNNLGRKTARVIPNDPKSALR
jgi:hypothetical protein